jgi:hypothetical protein
MIPVVNSKTRYSHELQILANAEPCPTPGTASFFCGPCPHETEAAKLSSACDKGGAIRA